jgi:hypothetical protein
MADFMIMRNSAEETAWQAVLTYITDHLSGDSEATKAAYRLSNFKGHKFKVVQGGFRKAYSKRGEAAETIGNHLDVSVGGIWMMGDYIIRCKSSYYESEDANLGTKADLEGYFLLNNPQGTSTNVIHIVDHYATDDTSLPGVPCILYGDLAPEPITTLISGTEALYTIRIQLRALEAVA